jgi:hypothetical protein
MSGHTPGPWRYEYTNSAHESYVAVSSNLLANGATVVIGQCAGPDREANARLIAAAPLLLEALQRALTCMKAGASLEHGAGYEVFKDSPIGIARAAIAAATGDNP